MSAPLPSADRNLLFGILALQMDFIRRDALIAAMHAWVLDKAKPLGQILLEQGTLAATNHELLELMVQRHLEMHGHDAERSLAALPAPEAVRADLRHIADGDVQARLAQLPATPSVEHDSLATTAHVSADGDRFQILRPHASGGLGEVFVARDSELNREVALKEIQARHADHPESRARFVREAEITGSLEHPGIVPVYALGQHGDGRPYYAMRFIRGDSLKQAVERYHNPQAQGLQPLGEVVARSRSAALSQGLQPLSFHSLPFRQLLNRFIAVCNAIAYAHSRGVIHRDLKPSNIMLGEFGETLVVDWGLAKAVPLAPQPPLPSRRAGEPDILPLPSLGEGRGDGDLTRTGQALGTPAYMSPEQAAGRLDHLGPASDVYSLGATLYHLLTGQAPFAKSDAGEMLNKVQRGDFPSPRSVNRQVPAALEAICLKAMALRAQDRYASAKALGDDLEHWLADEAVTAHAEPWQERLGRWVRHHKGLVGSMAAVVAVALTVAIAGWLVREASDRQAKEKELRGIAEDERVEAERQKGNAIDQSAEAVKQRTIAETERKRADRYLYFSRINLADRAWQEAHIARMDELLEQTQPQHTSGKDLPGFERAYLLRLRHDSLLTFKGHTSGVTRVAFSPDGQRIASASWDRTVRVWDARTGQVSLTLKGHTSSVHSVVFSPDGQRLASASWDRTVKVWDALTGQEILTLKGHTREVNSVVFSPDGQRLASASSDRTVKVWDARTGKESLTLKGHTDSVNSVAFSPDGQQIASASVDRTVKVWNTRTGKEKITFKGHTGRVFSVAFSPDGQRLASAGDDRAVKVWDAHTGKEVIIFKRQSRYVFSVAFSPDGQRLASAGYEDTVKVCDARTGKEIITLKGHVSGIVSIAFSPDGQRLASACLDGTVNVWDARTDQEALTLMGHTSYVQSVAFSPDGRRLASASGDKTVKVWDARTGQEALTLKGHTSYVQSVAFSPDGQRIASAGNDRTVKVWNAHTGQEIRTFKGHTGPVQSVAFSPDGQHLASASSDGTMKVWDARTGQEILTLKGHKSSVSCVAFSPDGQRLASASFDRTVKVWDARTGQEILTLHGHTIVVHSVAFSPDGQRIASASGDNAVKVWDAHTGKLRLTLKGHSGNVWSVAFSPDGQRLASAGYDQTVKVWDVRNGQEGITLKGHTDFVYSVTFSPDGHRLASASSDGTVKIWDATPAREASDMQRQAISYFRFVAETVVLKDDMIRLIRQTPTLSEPVREQALAFARDYREIPARINEASWSVVRGCWARPGAYPLALRQGEAACRQEPGNGLFLTTLGAAQYRNSHYAAALKTLTQSDKLNAARFKHSLPADLALLAMTQFQLGQKADAAVTLGRLRDLMKKLSFDRDAEELLKEAERVVEAKK